MLFVAAQAGIGEQVRAHLHDLDLREWVAILPLLVLMLWMGTATRTFLPQISAANTRILQQTQLNVQFYVKAKPPVPTSLAEVRDAR